MQDSIFEQLKNLVTEARNPISESIDIKSTEEILRIINTEDKTIPAIVECEIPYIAQAVEILVDTFKKGGRLFYIGAGTSGRLGILDAAECPPTFGTNPEMIQGIIAGGEKAVIYSQEGSEDNFERGASDLMSRGFTKKDVACGIAASYRTPYVLASIQKAKEIGSKTIYITCNPRSELKLDVDVAICPVVGPEVVMGSTRMKAGTATKLVLNMLTTTAMIRMGKVYGNMMVDLMMTSRKLEERSKRTVMMVTGVSYKEAAAFLKRAEGHVKTALVMILANVEATEARKRLELSDGFVRGAIELP
ncbi:N-acetylmuramic acid 6-phosphate etherase [candidate division KSB1 bacterium]|nr:N-acetylmuramic acid 6-phosphate etherase [candidate division KSB1 bacterium]NIR70090.1 N-acetylmuramic acid 6-phosphate etherase [candidate division KSB1 bacterium]NIS27515.1 N-acetylmuramic acid 6-phosphate etherase [candidate division KSB1 bacterium]NIT74366.1 N-acetylmuramic acid 6-phosphate etherase [candidate division KSB1 bacterium]NIU28233.1 N-acetylmuramic acid 6-phosphate etherase [candidate division KSB1 bacterium]